MQPAAFVIEKGVPMPALIARGRGRKQLRPWHTLEIGDSVVVETLDFARTGAGWARSNGRAFAIRRQKARPYHYRIWRMA